MFPIIHTNFWDALIAIPAIIVLIEIFKVFFPYFRSWEPTIAIVLGFLLSICMVHGDSLWTGVIMGVFYGVAAVGAYSSFINAVRTYRNKDSNRRFH
ncbi:hypothetical protein KUV80_13045 [Fictibacillus nanhaiensis]|nr:hypothetical protein [Fictibacillus nanhaiensis]